MSTLSINPIRLCAVIILSVVLMGTLLYSPPTASAQDLPPRPGDPPIPQPTGLPPRPTPTPPNGNGNGNGGSSSFTPGAFIKLSIGHAAGRWSVVQWKDHTGSWQNVNGWQGMLDGAGEILWFVEQNDFGKGPFRWALSGANGQPAQEVSNPFHLPTQFDQVIPVSSLHGAQPVHVPVQHHYQPPAPQHHYQPPAPPRPHHYQHYQPQPAVVHYQPPHYGYGGQAKHHYQPQPYQPAPQHHYQPPAPSYNHSAHAPMQNGCYAGPNGYNCPPSY